MVPNGPVATLLRAMAERPSQEEIRRRVLEDRPSFAIPVEVPDPPVTPRDSATVILLRDGARGLEVFMLERHLNSDFAGGAYVFPGGTVDPRDTDPMAHRFLEAPQGMDPAFYLCAIRETFEEAGVLLARRGPDPVRLTEDAARFAAYRRELAGRGGSLAAFAEREGLRFSGDLMHYFSRWVTPEFSPKRYDARFFVATMPEGQDPLHDDVETTASTWIRPADAIAQARDGLFSIIFPTRKTLEELERFERTADVISSTAGKEIQAILPTVVISDGQARVVLPGDPTLHEP
jgi:8-oxo-dGTP pyrophosphatase MutT (NUDIX family)